MSDVGYKVLYTRKINKIKGLGYNVNELDNVQDRRRFFRIDDAINLYYKVVDENLVVASKVTEGLLDNCSLITALDMLDQEGRFVLSNIEQQQPEVAEYLRIIDSKVNLLAQAVTQKDHDVPEDNLCNTNISASGLAIEIDHSIEVGKFLEIKLLLTSCIAVIMVYGRVVYCKDNSKNDPKNPYTIAIDYVKLNEHDREVLVKHIAKRQMQQASKLQQD